MMGKKSVILLVAGLIWVFFAGCGTTSTDRAFIDFREKEAYSGYLANDPGPKPIRIALASVWSPKETIGYYRKIAHYVSQELGAPVVLVQRTKYEEVNLLMASGEADIAFSSTGAYSAYRGLTDLEILAMQEYQGNSLYTTYVIVPKNSRIERMEDLRGKVFGFTDPLSYSGHLAIIEYLKRRQEVPERFFKRYIYTYNHDKSIWAVANNLVDGASIDSMIYDYALIKTPELISNIRIIATMGPAPTGPIVMRKNLSPELKEKLRTVFLNMDKDSDARLGMQGLLIDRFVSPQPELYEPLRTLYDRTDGLL